MLYKSYKNKYDGWVLPKGTVEAGEEYKETAIREVLEETSVHASIIKYIGKSQYSFSVPEDTVAKDVHWYLMMSNKAITASRRKRNTLWIPDITKIPRSLSSFEVPMSGRSWRWLITNIWI